MAWRIIYFLSSSGRNPVAEFIDLCSKKQQVKILRILTYLKEYGVQTAIPHLKKISGTQFWEIRILGRDNIRIIYAVEVGKLILLLHGFFKKTQKTAEKEIEVCHRRYKVYKRRLTK